MCKFDSDCIVIVAVLLPLRMLDLVDYVYLQDV